MARVVSSTTIFHNEYTTTASISIETISNRVRIYFLMLVFSRLSCCSSMDIVAPSIAIFGSHDALFETLTINHTSQG